MSDGASGTAPDPLAETLRVRQPSARFDAFLREVIRDMAAELSPDAPPSRT